MRPATKSQISALFFMTGKCLELRQLKLSFEIASSMISRLKVEKIDPSIIRNELIDIGSDFRNNIPELIDWQKLYNEADQAGKNAAEKLEYPQFGCGFAWIKFKGNTSWSKWTKR